MIKNKYENLVEQLTPQFTGNKSLFHWCSASGDAKFKSILSEHDSQALQCDCRKARKKSAGNHCPKGSGRLSTQQVLLNAVHSKIQNKAYINNIQKHYSLLWVMNVWSVLISLTLVSEMRSRQNLFTCSFPYSFLTPLTSLDGVLLHAHLDDCLFCALGSNTKIQKVPVREVPLC